VCSSDLSGFGALARLAAKLRPIVASRITSAKTRRIFWQTFFKSRARTLILDGHKNAAWQAANNEIEATLLGDKPIGQISLVGVGSGDTDLLTLKALQRLREADVIVLDGLVNSAVLEYARRDALRLYVGKTPGQAFIKQSKVNAAMTKEALEGSNVVRLQGGDDLHFTRNIAALEPLKSLGIEIEIIPGVSAHPLKSALLTKRKIYNQAVTAKG